MCQSREQLAALPPGPKAVLATLPSLEAGPAQELFVEWAGDPHSLILFTERPPVRSHSSPALLTFIEPLSKCNHQGTPSHHSRQQDSPPFAAPTRTARPLSLPCQHPLRCRLAALQARSAKARPVASR